MKTKQTVITLFLFLSVILAACSPKVASVDAMMESDQQSESMAEKDEVMMEDDLPMEEKDDDSMMEAEDESMSEQSRDNGMEGSDKGVEEKDSISSNVMMAPEWFSTPLINVQTGDTFSLADLKGKVVLVETMAMWCSNCLKQQGQVNELHKLLGERDDFISLGIDIDPNENTEALKSYIDKNSFGWWYTVAPTDLAREIGQLYGDQFLNPPSTPMLIIDSHGEVHPLPFGIKSAESLLEALQPFLDGEM